MKKYQFDEEKLLSMFTGKDALHPLFDNPWLSGELVCASETHILIQIKAECLHGQYSPVGKLNAIKYVENCNYTLTLRHLEVALDKVPKCDEKILVERGAECLECGGCGAVTVEYESKSGRIYEIECDCPVCDGYGMKSRDRYAKTGKMIPDKDARIAINEYSFNARFIQILYDAMKFIGVDAVKVVSIGDKQPAVFRVDENIEILLMPRHCDEKMENVIILH